MACDVEHAHMIEMLHVYSLEAGLNWWYMHVVLLFCRYIQCHIACYSRLLFWYVGKIFKDLFHAVHCTKPCVPYMWILTCSHMPDKLSCERLRT